jgi:hypothetical protein
MKLFHRAANIKSQAYKRGQQYRLFVYKVELMLQQKTQLEQTDDLIDSLSDVITKSNRLCQDNHLEELLSKEVGSLTIRARRSKENFSNLIAAINRESFTANDFKSIKEHVLSLDFIPSFPDIKQDLIDWLDDKLTQTKELL